MDNVDDDGLALGTIDDDDDVESSDAEALGHEDVITVGPADGIGD